MHRPMARKHIRELTHMVGLTSIRFRWAHLSLDNLAIQNTPKQVRQALEILPPTLEDSYVDFLLRVPEKNRVLARKALLWLMFARRPLELVELNEAAIIQEGQSIIDEEDRLSRLELIPEICHGLIDCHSGFTTLAHSSVARFLTTPKVYSSKVAYFAINPEEGDRLLMHMCLQYLSMKSFASGFCKTGHELLARLESYPLLSYASNCWATHASKVDLNQADVNAIMTFLQTQHLPAGGNYSAWIHVLLPDIDARDTTKLQMTSPLYYAASFGLSKIVSTILDNDKGIDIDARGGRHGSTPLFVACYRGYYDVARILVYAGASVSLIDMGTMLNTMELLAIERATSLQAENLLRFIAEMADSRTRTRIMSLIEHGTH
jgi:hypothetical protein